MIEHGTEELIAGRRRASILKILPLLEKHVLDLQDGGLDVAGALHQSLIQCAPDIARPEDNILGRFAALIDGVHPVH